MENLIRYNFDQNHNFKYVFTIRKSCFMGSISFLFFYELIFFRILIFFI